MPIMPYLAIPRLPFLRDITDWISQYIIHYKPYIRFYTNKDLMIQPIIQQAAEINDSVAVGSIFRGTGNADEGR